MEPFTQFKEHYLQLEKWEQQYPQLIAGFTTKSGGVSQGAFSSFNLGLHVHDEKADVIKNREILANEIAFPLANWVLGEQIHDIKIKHVNGTDRGKGAASLATACQGADGLITKTKGILLSAFFADCIPLYFIEPKKQIIGIAHAGWKGTVGGIAEKMIKAFENQGARKEDILVSIGPGISQENYEVDSRVAAAITGNYHGKILKEKENNHYLLDLKGLNREILLKYGVLRHNIDITDYCTYRDEALFFSHRRDQEKTGRMLGFIGFKE